MQDVRLRGRGDCFLGPSEQVHWADVADGEGDAGLAVCVSAVDAAWGAVGRCAGGNALVSGQLRP